MRKADLITALTTPAANVYRRVPAPAKLVDLLDSPVPDISAPVLQPTAYTPPKSVIGNITSNIKSFADWLLDYVPEKIKRPINEKLNSLKATVAGVFKKYGFNETKSALSGVTKQYRLDGHEGKDPKTFMDDVKLSAVALLKRSRQTKTNIVLTCEMERVDMKSGEVTTAEIPFATKAEVILESTDVKELYENAVDRILEIMANFQQRGSNWRFKSVVKLEINAFVYRPLKGSSYIPLPKELADKKAIINMKQQR
jgi:hypothetical protein